MRAIEWKRVNINHKTTLLSRRSVQLRCLTSGWSGCVRGELNGVQGMPGDGKTWLLCELAAQTGGGIVQGVRDETDCMELTCGNVLYLSVTILLNGSTINPKPRESCKHKGYHGQGSS